MKRGLHLTLWSRRERSAAAFLLAISLTSCIQATKPPAGPAPPQLHAVSAQVAPAHDSNKHIVLPNPALLGCNTANCTQVLPDEDAGPGAIYPWQVSLDFTDGKVIGLMAFYDQPATIDNVQAAIDERYGQWAMADFRTGPVRIWRVDPPHKFAIQLSGAYGGTLLIYLTYDPKHPMSDGAEPYWDCLVEKSVQCADHRRRASWVPDLLR
jgi:hypothetical protein